MTNWTILYVIMVLLISKPLFAICQKPIFGAFAQFHGLNFCSMSTGLDWETRRIVGRGVDYLVSQNYENWTVQNLYKTRIIAYYQQ